MRPQLNWREMQPILLRSAVLVGFAAAVAATVTSDVLFPSPEPRPAQEATVLIVQEEPVDAAIQRQAEVAKPAEVIAARAAVTDGPGIGSAQPAAALVEAAPESPAEATVTTHAPARVVATAADTGAVSAMPTRLGAELPGEGPSWPVAAPAALVGRDAAAPAPELSGAAEANVLDPAVVGSLPSAECPRDWVSVEGRPAAAAASCEKLAALLPEPGDAVAQRALEEAASERATELAALQVVPRIPKARPAPPARPRKTGRKSGWPADDPPACGKKRARWRYVNDVPTWYCR